MEDKKRKCYAFLCPECHFLLDTLDYYERLEDAYTASLDENGEVSLSLRKSSEKNTETLCTHCCKTIQVAPEECIVVISFENGRLKVKRKYSDDKSPERIYIPEHIILRIAEKLFDIKTEDPGEAVNKLLEHGISLTIKECNGEIVVVYSP